MTLLYFAAPLLSAAERAFNFDLTQQIERLGIDVFLPQRDGVEANSEHAAMTRDLRRAERFRIDRDQVFSCDVFLFVTDGRVPDEGAAVELGMAYTHRELADHDRLIVALHTDVRTAFPHAALNPMIGQAVDLTVHDAGELLDALGTDVPGH